MRPVGSTLTSPRSGEPDGPAGMKPAVQRPQYLVDFGVGAGEARHHFGGGEAQVPRDVGVVGEPVGGGGIPIAACNRRHQFPCRGLGLRRPMVRSSVPSSARPSACRRPGSACSPPNSWRARRMASTRSSSASPRGLLAEDVQAVADLDVLDLAQPAVDVQHHVVEGVLFGLLGQAQVVIHLGRADQRPDLLADGGQLAGVQRGDVGVLVQQLLQTRDVAVGFGAGHRRDEVVDEHRVRAPFGLGALARDR